MVQTARKTMIHLPGGGLGGPPTDPYDDVAMPVQSSLQMLSPQVFSKKTHIYMFFYFVISCEFLRKCNSFFFRQGFALLPTLECSGMIVAHGSLWLLGSSHYLASAS